MEKTKHVLGLSGGKDSAALAVYMHRNYPEIEIEYFFTDTGKELHETYDYLNKLEGLLDKQITRLNPDRDFDFWLRQYGNLLPSPQTRWCTRQLKIRPFEKWVREFLNDGFKVISYVAIRSDEEYREGYDSKDDDLIVKLPFKEDGVDKEGVFEILETEGLGRPGYYDWRSRSGCTFCFYQQKIEWVELYRRYYDDFLEAVKYEKTALEHGSPFTWSQGESLLDLVKDDRIKEIEIDHQRRKEALLAKLQENPLRPKEKIIDNDDLYGISKVCLSCHK